MLLLPRRHMKLSHDVGPGLLQRPGPYSLLKFAAEWGFSLILLVLAAPILAAVAVLVKFTSSGPIFIVSLGWVRAGVNIEFIRSAPCSMNAKGGWGGLGGAG